MTDANAQREHAVEIVRTLRHAGHVAYLAGGCVRDELLGLSPSDYDVATDARPEQIERHFPRSSKVGAAFGVMLVRHHLPGGSTLVTEVATFRSDGTYSDSRRPDAVTFSTPQEDASRRDFTVNALFLDPLDTPRGEDGPLPSGWKGGRVIDYVGGLADLRARILRAVGDPDARLREDHLRALRAVRLAARLGFSIDPATASAIARNASELRGVSRERVGEELRMMFESPARTRAAILLHELALERQMLGAQDAAWSLRDERAPALASLPCEASFALCLCAWSLDLGVSPTTDDHRLFAEKTRAALCLSNLERQELEEIFRVFRSMLTQWPSLGTAARKRLAATREAGGARMLLSVFSPTSARHVSSDIRALEQTPSGLAPVPLLSGDTLVSMGLKPGPHFRRVLEAVYDAQLEGRVLNLDQAKELARDLCV